MCGLQYAKRGGRAVEVHRLGLELIFGHGYCMIPIWFRRDLFMIWVWCKLDLRMDWPCIGHALAMLWACFAWPLRGALEAESPKRLKYKKCLRVIGT